MCVFFQWMTEEKWRNIRSSFLRSMNLYQVGQRQGKCIIWKIIYSLCYHMSNHSTVQKIKLTFPYMIQKWPQHQGIQITNTNDIQNGEPQNHNNDSRPILYTETAPNTPNIWYTNSRTTIDTNRTSNHSRLLT